MTIYSDKVTVKGGLSTLGSLLALINHARRAAQVAVEKTIDGATDPIMAQNVTITELGGNRFMISVPVLYCVLDAETNHREDDENTVEVVYDFGDGGQTSATLAHMEPLTEETTL